MKLEIHQIQERLLSLPNSIQEAGEAYAKAKSEYEFLSEMKSVLKSELSFKASETAKKEGKKLSEWQVRVMAEWHPDFRKHLEAIRIAQENSLKAQARYIAAQTEFEAIRSLSALEKAMTRNL